MSQVLSELALNQLFREARTVHAFQPVAISDETIHALYDLLKWGPTAFNAQPARFVFVRSAEAKEKLKPALSGGNVSQTLGASATVIVAYDTQFQEHLPQQFPAYDAKPLFDGNAALTQATAERNSALQGAYLILAARALGIEEALVVGNRIGLLSPHPGRVRAEINSHAYDLQSSGSADFRATAQRIHRLLFEETPESASA